MKLLPIGRLAIIVIATTATVRAYKNERSIGQSYNADFPPYQGYRQHPPYHEQHQPFREPYFRQQSYRSVAQPPSSSFRDQSSVFAEYPSFKDQSIYGKQFFRSSAPFKVASPFGQSTASFRDQSSFRTQLPFKDRITLREHYSFVEQPRPKEQSPYMEQSFKDQVSYEEQRVPSFKDTRPYPDPPIEEKSSYHKSKEEYRAQSERFSDLLSSYQGESSPSAYEKTMDSYGESKEQSFDNNSYYLKYGNHGLGFPSIPTASHENALPLSIEISTKSSEISSATDKQSLQAISAISTTQTTPKVRLSSSDESQIVSKSITTTARTTVRPKVESDTLADVSTTTSTFLVPTMPSITVTQKQFSNEGRISMGTATNLSDVATEASIPSFHGNILSQDDKFSTSLPPSSIYLNNLRNGIQNEALNNLLMEDNKSFKGSYLLPTESESALKNGIRNSGFHYVMPRLKGISSGSSQGTILDYLPSTGLKSLSKGNSMFDYALTEQQPKISLKNDIQSLFLNSLLRDESKDALKSNVQSPLLDYVLHMQPKQNPMFQHSSQPLAIDYLSQSLRRVPKFTLPAISIDALLTQTRPLETINYLSSAIPRVPFLNSDTSASAQLGLGSSLSAGLPTSLQQSLSTSIPSSIPGSISSGISTGIPGSISTSIPASIPTMNFASSFQHAGQMQHFQGAGTSPYSSEMQLQLGGFNGIDYAMQPNNPGTGSMELGIAKLGLSLPEFQRTQTPTFAKIGFGQELW